MNCCDDFGQCTQGPNCPARANRECHEPADTKRPSLLSRLRSYFGKEAAVKKAERDLKHRPRLRSVRFWNF